MKFPSELRFDVASEDWVVIATGRAKRPDTFKRKDEMKRTDPEDCPFCDVNSQEESLLVISDGKEIPLKDSLVPDDWSVVSFPNKYPAFIPEGEAKQEQEGPLYIKMNAVGHHEVVVTRDHDESLGLFDQARAEELVEAYYLRYKDLMEKDMVRYIAIFHNHGPEAGASIYHPHSQIITTPLIDTDLKTALKNSGNFYKKNGECVYCQMMEWEMKTGDRVVFENDDFLVICPFASKAAFQMIVTPKRHSPFFYDVSKKERAQMAEALKEALSRLYKGLNNPSYNFYLHSAPVDDGEYPFYHWHWTIVPKTSTPAGFELGMEMEISVIEPKEAAEYLRQQ